MNKYIKTILLSTALLCFGAGSASAAQFSDAKSGAELSAQQLAQKLSKYEVVFFGEYHDQGEIHKAELELLQALHKIKGEKLALSMEMFEADNQTKLDSFLAGTLGEEEFLATSRPWPNYKTDYAPLVNFAKKNNMPVVAANVPRFLAAHVAKNNGSVAGIEEQYLQFLPKHTYAPEGAYKDKFYAQMTSPEAPMKMPPQRLAAVYAAQCLKDDKMAESIAAFSDAHKKMQVLHINGCFHSDAHLGTTQKLEALRPKLKVAVITPLERKQKGVQPAGDFVVWFNRK
ncbi:ChaN family lipoprotein [Phascolarctobacterium succinatutens]|uniref:ChaN family lipoprotein n=1 Tax=Phascolarctobacterium succinatutens TaxID=626940 RepID=UPI00261F236F|nr:ChaN family lipoprotein [Phascolarctobacterium succinatutens]